LKVNDDTCNIRSIVESAPKLAEEIHNTVSAPTDWLVGCLLQNMARLLCLIMPTTATVKE
jgi:hypothetical protein